MGIRGKARQAAYKATAVGSDAFQALIARRADAQIEFFDTAEFPWVADIESRADAIRAELEPLLGRVEEIPNFQQVQQEQRELTDDDDWKVFIFYIYGSKYEQNCLRCPNTTEALKLIPGMTTAMFSILKPGKHIPAHGGPWKGVLRYHLALRTPADEESCRIRRGFTDPALASR